MKFFLKSACGNSKQKKHDGMEATTRLYTKIYDEKMDGKFQSLFEKIERYKSQENGPTKKQLRHLNQSVKEIKQNLNEVIQTYLFSLESLEDLDIKSIELASHADQFVKKSQATPAM